MNPTGSRHQERCANFPMGLVVLFSLLFADIAAADIISGKSSDLFALSGTGQSEVAAELRVATSLYDYNNLQPCLEQLIKCKIAHDELPPPEVILAVLHCSHGHAEAARIMLGKVESKHFNTPSFVLALARVNLIEDRKIEAWALIDRAERRADEIGWPDPRQSRFRIECALERVAIAQSLEQWEEVILLLRDVVEQMPEDRDLQMSLAYALFRDGNRSASAKQLRQADIETPELLLAQWYAQQGDAARAEKVLREANQADPGDIAVQIALVKYLLDQQSVDDAGDLIVMLAEKEDDRSARDVSLLAARLATIQGRYADAVQTLRPLYEADPSDVVIAVALTRSMLATDDPSLISQGIDLAFAKATQHRGVQQTDSTLGWAQVRRGDAAAGEATLMGIASQFKISADTAYFTARALAANAKEPLARELIGRAFESKGPFDLRLHAEKWLASIEPTIKEETELPFDDKIVVGDIPVGSTVEFGDTVNEPMEFHNIPVSDIPVSNFPVSETQE